MADNIWAHCVHNKVQLSQCEILNCLFFWAAAPSAQSWIPLTKRFTESYSSVNMICKYSSLNTSSSSCLKFGKAMQHLSESIRLWCFLDSPGIAQALVRWVGKIRHLLNQKCMYMQTRLKWRQDSNLFKICQSQPINSITGMISLQMWHANNTLMTKQTIKKVFIDCFVCWNHQNRFTYVTFIARWRRIIHTYIHLFESGNLAHIQ